MIYSSGCVIRNILDWNKMVLVKRNGKDRYLPLVWSFPAGYVEENERVEDAARRAGREKLNLELQIGKLIGRGNMDRGDHVLHMEVFDSWILSGDINLRRNRDHINEYVSWEWGEKYELEEAARKGSLGANIFYKSIGWGHFCGIALDCPDMLVYPKKRL